MLPAPSRCLLSRPEAVREVLGETGRVLKKLGVGQGEGNQQGRPAHTAQAAPESLLERNLRNLAGPTTPFTDEETEVQGSGAELEIKPRSSAPPPMLFPLLQVCGEVCVRARLCTCVCAHVCM